MSAWFRTPDEVRAMSHKPVLAQEHSETSKAAARSVSDPMKLARLERRVYDCIRGGNAEFTATGGMTDEEGCDRTGLSPSTYRPRRVRLVELNLVRDSGRTRPGRSGRAMTIWIAS